VRLDLHLDADALDPGPTLAKLVDRLTDAFPYLDEEGEDVLRAALADAYLAGAKGAAVEIVAQLVENRLSARLSLDVTPTDSDQAV
jgi:hypothetical protein